jgi:tetratricopeptide (TPR) repeat protein
MVSLIALFRQRRSPEKSGPTTLRPPDQPLRLSEEQQKRRNSAAQIHFNVGVEFHQQQQHDDAIARYRQAIQNDQHFGPAYINMGLAYLAKGKRKEAIQALRGAIQSADDQKTQNEAWHQLHELSGVSPANEVTARQNMSEMGATPWTDTKPRPNWLALGITGGLLLIAGILTYGYLLTQLIGLLRN